MSTLDDAKRDLEHNRWDNEWCVIGEHRGPLGQITYWRELLRASELPKYDEWVRQNVDHDFWPDGESPSHTPVSPQHYKLPNGVEVRQVSGYLTSFGGQAVQYIARATRTDGVVKGEPIEDLKKAIKFIEFEIERLEERADG